ncbi:MULTISPECIES: thiamine pyrophosphate-binding protein [unclassified Ruegeria]|uniref:thiamine pyrophosphate-binding protein n=1 Tax=unclassified Ruegeria TaxID=2625375 RepID=UPI00149294FA|nr:MULTISPECIES: thiamine pyrophosphate-binding protein [unclassified Ruegeria]NOD85346.1 thiamine pyrophosphate-binding protein [Ruegeria sp. HKCCD6119]
MKTEKDLRAADLVARRLYEAGCRHAFGMPGGEVLTIVDALKTAGIKFILCKHENSAGFMAEGAHHMTGAPGILVATVGPGAVNGVNVVANAQQDRVPLIVLTGCVDATEALTYTHQVLDHQAVFRPITKASFVLTADGADTIADKAVAIATDGRDGPVHIDVPISVADAKPGPVEMRRRAKVSAVVPGEDDLTLARSWLASSKRPVMIAGLDALKDNASAAVLRFCEAHNVPVITTYKAKGIIAEDHPLCLGGAGLSPKNDDILLPFVKEADLIICAGYDPIEMRVGWRDVWDPEIVNVIDITAEPNTHYMHQSTLQLVSHVGLTLDAMSDCIATTPSWSGGGIDDVRDSLTKAVAETEAWGPGVVIDTCRDVLPKNTVATVDSGAHRILLSQKWSCYAPKGLLQSSALCTMGCAVPLAMGASLIEPERTVVSFSGDAGMLMVAGELSTAAELGLKTIFVVFVDASLALIEIKQRGRQLKNAGVDFDKHDFARLAEAFGGSGHTVGNAEELKAALMAARSADSFTVIAAVIDRGAYDGRI